MFDQALLHFNENFINSQDPHSQIENNEIPGAEYPNENVSEDAEANKTFAIPNFMPKILPDDRIVEGIDAWDSKQKEVFNAVHTWAKDYVKYDEHNVEPVHIFLSGNGGTGKSHLVKVISEAISKTFLYH